MDPNQTLTDEEDAATFTLELAEQDIVRPVLGDCDTVRLSEDSNGFVSLETEVTHAA